MLDFLRSLFTFDSLRLASWRVDHSKPLPSPNATLMTCFGQDLIFHAYKDGGRHLGPTDLDPYRQVGDPVLDDLLDFMHDSGCALKPGDDLLAKAKSYPMEVQDKIESFLEPYRTVPTWVDKEQLARGQKVFLCYFPAIVLSLYYRSLCAGFSIPKIAKVIMATGYLAPPSTPEQVAYRLVDTGALLNMCCAGRSSSDDNDNGVAESTLPLPGTIGWKACLYVRILHAKVRRKLLQRQRGSQQQDDEDGASSWDTHEYGVPINQEDMAATLLAFSINTLKGIEFVGGVRLSKQEEDDYIALWRYLGWILGVPVQDYDSHSVGCQDELRPLDPCGPGWKKNDPSPLRHGESLLQSIILHLMKPDQSSIVVSHHLLKVGRPVKQSDRKDQVNENTERDERIAQKEREEYMFYVRAAICRSFIGEPLANSLELPIHSRWRMRCFIQARAWFILGAARCSTWVAIFLPWTRPWLENFFLKQLGRFHDIWTERHPTRMAGALKIKCPCPFAMIKPE